MKSEVSTRSGILARYVLGRVDDMVSKTCHDPVKSDFDESKSWAKTAKGLLEWGGYNVVLVMCLKLRTEKRPMSSSLSASWD